MSDTIDGLIRKISALEEELERAFDESRKNFAYRFEKRKIIFESELAKHHHHLKVGLWPYVRRARLMVVLTAPFIYVLIVPFILLDLLVTLYQATCFPVYGIKKVRRKDFIIFDRHHLAYLNALEKLNCCYCSYANGIIAYVLEIASRTEKHWCPIKHAKKVAGTHRRYAKFPDYGDAEAYREQTSQDE